MSNLELRIEEEASLNLTLGESSDMSFDAVDFVGVPFAPTVEVEDIEGGHRVSITSMGAEGKKTDEFDVMDGADGATGPQGPKGDSYEITSADYAAIAEVVEEDIQDVINAAQDATADATAAAAEARAASAATWLSGNVLFGELAEAAVLTTDDAYSAPPKFLSVYGKSTQDGTPTPSVPVPILSVDALTLHASADGTTDYTNWPVQIPLSNNVGRSLPDGTRDELTLSYIGPAQTEGWGVFGVELVQRLGERDLGSLTYIKDGANYQTFYSDLRNVGVYNTPLICTNYANTTILYGPNMPDNSIAITNSDSTPLLRIKDTAAYAQYDAAGFKSYVSGAKLVYLLPTPITHDLGTVELPILPNPLTAWADGGSAQPTMQLEYERALNIVIPRIEAQLADMATS